MYTEAEAYTKWCPHRSLFPRGLTNCIASDCMMWRWTITPEDAAAVNAAHNAGVISAGYCVLAK
jgi:hypothetical protein